LRIGLGFLLSSILREAYRGLLTKMTRQVVVTFVQLR